MYEFSKQEKKFLRDISESNDGEQLKALLNNVKIYVNSAARIKKAGGDASIQVEAAALIVDLFDTIIEAMKKRDNSISDLPRKNNSEDDWT